MNASAMKLLIILVVQIYFVYAADNKCEHECQTDGTCKASQISETLCHYLFIDKKLEWHENKMLCNNNALSMVTLPRDLIGWKFSEEKVFEGFPPNEYVWLGGQVNDFSNWTFVNGIQLEEKYANKLSATQAEQENHLCVTVSPMTNDVSVQNVDCTEKHHFICRFDDWQSTPSFYMSDTTATWFEASSRCDNLGGKLFFLNDGENMKFIEKKLNEYKDEKFYIGVTLRYWKWEGGQAIQHYKWMANEPNTYAERCIAMYPESGEWLDMGCTLKMTAFCQGSTSVDPLPTNSTETCPECGNGGLIAGIVIVTILAILGIASTVALTLHSRKSQQTKDNNRTENEAEHPLMEVVPQKLKMDSSQKWPGKVVVKDEGSTCSIYLGRPKDLQTENIMETEAFNSSFHDGYIELTVKNPTSEENILYKFKKHLPEGIMVQASFLREEPDNFVIELRKANENHPWAKHIAYLEDPCRSIPALLK